ncbi:MAG: glycerophosphodiester phosphodiesterase [Gemmatimonadota bacterium]
MTFFSGPLPRQFAHRGASGTCPENTLAAFREARAAGADGFELDVHRTADGEIVVYHDSTLDRTTDGRGALADLTLAELRELDAGGRFTPDQGRTYPFQGQGVSIPTLREILEEFRRIPIIVEIKQVEPPLEGDLRQVIGDCDAGDWTLVFSLAQEPLDRYRALAPEQPTGYGPEDVAEFLKRVNNGSWDGYTPPAAAFAVPVRWHGLQIVNASFVEAAHRFDREVFVWTVNEEREMKRLLDLGVDGLISDFPGRLAQILQRRGDQDGSQRSADAASEGR